MKHCTPTMVCRELALGRRCGPVVRQTTEWMKLVWLPITDGEMRNAYKVLAKTPKGKRQLGRLRRNHKPDYKARHSRRQYHSRFGII
jgi:hypothetical protein